MSPPIGLSKKFSVLRVSTSSIVTEIEEPIFLLAGRTVANFKTKGFRTYEN